MIKITGNKGCTVYYTCECGVKGRCMIKPLVDDGMVIVNITCPLCYSSKRVKLIQYEGNKEEAMATDKLSWACVLFNEVTDYELQED